MQRYEAETSHGPLALKSGRFYKIAQRVQAIPAGIYRFEGWRGIRMEFSVGESRAVRFFIREVDSELVAPMPYKTGLKYCLAEREFFQLLYENIGSEIEELLKGSNKKNTARFDRTTF